MSLIKASRCRPAPSTRSSGSSVLLCSLRILPQHLTDADDGIERRAQLMAHVGEELRLVLARLGKLAALVLNFVEQADVLNGDHCLVSKRAQNGNLFIRKRPHLVATDHQSADGLGLAQQRGS